MSARGLRRHLGWVLISCHPFRNTGLAMLMLTLFFESVCFPTIVALGIRGLGRHTKRGSGWIVGGVSGGACGEYTFHKLFPSMKYLVPTSHTPPY